MTQNWHIFTVFKVHKDQKNMGVNMSKSVEVGKMTGALKPRPFVDWEHEMEEIDSSQPSRLKIK
jgi:hypothetical protein